MTKARKQLRNLGWPLLCGGGAFALILVLYAALGLAPFGSVGLADRQVLTMLSYYQDVLAGRNSIAYTWSRGLGGTGFPLHRYLKLVPLCETISDEEMEKLRQEAKEKQDRLFGTTPPPAEEEDSEEGEAFPEQSTEEFAQAPVNQAPDQTVDGYDAFNIGDGSDE